MKLKRNELTVRQVQKLFGVTLMTVTNWRAGKNGRTPLPFHTKPRGEQRHLVFFKQGEVTKWARRNGIEMVLSPKDLLRQHSSIG